MDTQTVIIERQFNVTPSRMWQALTDNSQLQQWYFVLPEFRAEVGFEFTFLGGEEGGEQFVHHCSVIEVIDEKKLAYTWRYENYPGDSVVTLEIFPNDNATLLRLTHSGLETIVPGNSAFAKENFVEGWTYFVHTALLSYLEKE